MIFSCHTLYILICKDRLCSELLQIDSFGGSTAFRVCVLGVEEGISSRLTYILIDLPWPERKYR
eukprot:Gb_16491 [translate_table: standard]